MDGVVNVYYIIGFLVNLNFDLVGGGVYNKGCIMIYEVGYWFNLFYIWGDVNCGDDLVVDIFIYEMDNGGCFSYFKINMCLGIIMEMFMNYMDYVNDDCMYMFL